MPLRIIPERRYFVYYIRASIRENIHCVIYYVNPNLFEAYQIGIYTVG